jgi:radical SAM/Cys-rich protein
MMKFGNRILSIQAGPLMADEVEILQVNVGYRCNMACSHCHVDAGPGRTQQMAKSTVEEVLHFLKKSGIGILDVTGGAPELNPHFRYLVGEAAKNGSHVVVRTNLTVLLEDGMQDLPDFYADNSVEIIASLPYYAGDHAGGTRGPESFRRSIRALQRLNGIGYGNGTPEKRLNLVYNPSGAFLSPPQNTLEKHYKRELLGNFGISFDRLYAFTNMPVGRFRDYLIRANALNGYMEMLASAFNGQTLRGLMCRHLINVRWDGMLFDCDFNQMLGLRVDEDCPQHIRDFDLSRLAGRKINVGEHCYGCAAEQGST